MLKVLNLLTALFILCIISLFSIGTSAQTKFNVSIYGGYSMPTADLEGTFPDTLSSGNKLDFTTARTLLTKKGFNFGGVFKLAVDTIGHAKLTGGLNYNLFTGTKDYAIPFEGTRTYKSSVSIFTISVGAEYSLIPDKKVSPYFGLDLAANFFGGKVESKGDTAFVLDRSQETRLGIIATAGINITITPKIGAVVGVKYSLANLIGKKTESTTTPTTPTDTEEEGLGALFELPLNDAATSKGQSKTFNYFQFYAGLSFNFGDFLNSKTKK